MDLFKLLNVFVKVVLALFQTKPSLSLTKISMFVGWSFCFEKRCWCKGEPKYSMPWVHYVIGNFSGILYQYVFALSSLTQLAALNGFTWQRGRWTSPIESSRENLKDIIKTPLLKGQTRWTWYWPLSWGGFCAYLHNWSCILVIG